MWEDVGKPHDGWVKTCDPHCPQHVSTRDTGERGTAFEPLGGRWEGFGLSPIRRHCAPVADTSKYI